MKINKNCISLFIFCLLLYGTFCGLIPLLDPDEPVYGETAREMLLTGDWISPRIYGDFWYDKPPLFYWLEAISFSIFGLSTWSARFPSVLLGALTPVYLYLSSRKLIGEKAALRGAFICASSLEIIVLARSSVTDTLLTFTLTLALMSFLRKEYFLAYISCGLSLLAKGPIGFGFPALIVGIWMILTRQFNLKGILGLKWYWGIPLACLVGLPWYIEMGMLHGDAFIDTFLGYHNITRFTSPEHAGQNHYWLYIVVLLAGFYPWCGTLPGICRRAKAWFKDQVLAYFMVWAAFIFVFFSISSTQLFSYILPMFPPLSLLAGKYMTDCEETGHFSKTFLAFHLIFAFASATAIALAPVEPLGGLPVRIGVVLFMSAAALYAAWNLKKGYFRHFMISQGALILIFVISVWGVFAPSVSSKFTSKVIAEDFAVMEKDPSIPIYIDTFYRPSVAFYTGIYGKALPEFDVRKKAVDERNEEKGVLLPGKDQETLPDTAYVLVQKKVLKNWPESEKKDLHLLWEKDTACVFFKTGG
ncbi:ArnT family glycosyltransferase [Dialister sp.]|uniref:ArnT family glycosyltransferase n=1 Tax=Dialister sp. TaxID=1955814 RepID=UPI002E8170DD|nr:glycosyltransferase family 39 protein [Dialister sp.]MEE3452619.1 glycosyltransferase family 39 protein [Dialister sp.]